MEVVKQENYMMYAGIPHMTEHIVKPDRLSTNSTTTVTTTIITTTIP